MAKSKLVKELANNETSLEIALSRLLIISEDINNTELFQWASNELNGYDHIDSVPSYRIVKNAIYKYSGINGSFKVTNCPLDFEAYFPDKEKDNFYIPVYDGIKTIESYVNGNDDTTFGRDLTFAAPIIYKKSGIQCSSITQVVPKNFFESVVNSVRTTLLKVLIKLDKEYGSIDDLDIDVSKKTEKEIRSTNFQINKLILYDNSISMRDGNEISKSSLLTGANNGQE